jgi:hypothetical protein
MGMAAKSTCETCKAFNALGGECRKRAPTAVPFPKFSPVGQLEGIPCAGVWPATSKDNWCLEHEADLTAPLN